MKIRLQKTHEDAVLPNNGTPLAACFDLYALEDVWFKPGEIKVVKTGWKLECPEGYRANVYVRSSTPLKKGFILANGVGIIDEDYRGELGVLLMNCKVKSYIEQPVQDEPFIEVGSFVSNQIFKGDRIAQLEIVPSLPAGTFELEVVNDLSSTKRGEGGFGSTG
jgi:dUTP pyrophosphatase